MDAEARTDNGHTDNGRTARGRGDRAADRSSSGPGLAAEGRHDVVRRMAVEDDTSRGGPNAGTHSSSAASADAVDALRRSIRDLKHDVRMLKVVVDKQSLLLETLLSRVDVPVSQRPAGTDE